MKKNRTTNSTLRFAIIDIYMESHIRNGLIYIAIAIVAVGLGCFLTHQYDLYQTKKIISSITPLRENNFNYKFIYPLLSYNLNGVSAFLEDTTLTGRLNDYIRTQYQKNNAESISVYYRDLLNNQWAGVGQDTQYHPASLMKVAVAMAYYRLSQLDPLIMQKALVYASDIDKQIKSIGVASSSTLVLGHSYTVKELIEKTLEDSDNGADLLLLSHADRKILNDILIDLNLSTPEKNPDYTISAKGYSALLRILYNATYLTEVDSEDMLSIMGESTYQDGIHAGLPSGTFVAQKFGEYVDVEAPTKKATALELHNCGVIYAESHPYQLCIMTKSKGVVDEKQLASIIKDISGLVYDYVDSDR